MTGIEFTVIENQIKLSMDTMMTVHPITHIVQATMITHTDTMVTKITVTLTIVEIQECLQIETAIPESIVVITIIITIVQMIQNTMTIEIVTTTAIKTEINIEEVTQE